MGKYLDELISSAQNKRIDDPEEAGRITTELAYCTLGELSSEMTKWGEGLLNFTYLPKENAYTLRFGELLNLLRIMCCELGLSDYAARLRLSLFDITSHSTEVKLFKAVTLGVFADFIDRKTGTLRGSSVYNRVSLIAEEKLGLEIGREMTFDKLLSKFTPMMYWNYASSLKLFTERISACALIIKLLMIDCFRFAFGELFGFSDLKDRLVEQTENWEKEDDFYSCYIKEDGTTLKFDRADHFGDEYDIEADDHLLSGKPAPSGFTMSSADREEWRTVTSKLRRIAEWQEWAEDWDRVRFRLLDLTKRKKSV